MTTSRHTTIFFLGTEKKSISKLQQTHHKKQSIPPVAHRNDPFTGTNGTAPYAGEEYNAHRTRRRI
jgi:hypothetical protein